MVVVDVVGGADGVQLDGGGVEGHDGLPQLGVGVTSRQEDLTHLRGGVHVFKLSV